MGPGVGRGTHMESKGTSYILRLYISGATEASRKVEAAVKEICENYLRGLYELEVIDVVADSRRALKDNVLSTPVLLKLAPPPSVKLKGDLSNPKTLLRGLGLK